MSQNQQRLLEYHRHILEAISWIYIYIEDSFEKDIDALAHFPMLFVTTNIKRMQHMIDVNKIFNDGEESELFLFTTKETLRNKVAIEKQNWVNGRGEKSFLF